jgi:hypothetical protein
MNDSKIRLTSDICIQYHITQTNKEAEKGRNKLLKEI